VAAAYAFARAGLRDVTLIESGPTLGGLAGNFEEDGHFYPLGYHHILHLDRTLHYFLHLVGALPRVRWRRVRMLFHTDAGRYDLGSLAGFASFPMSVLDKLRFARLMGTTFSKRDWTDWQDRSAAELVDQYAGAGVRTALFEPLTRLKFELPCDEVSGAWLGARLHFREGSAPLGYIPETTWTKVLCDGVTRLVEEAGVRVRLSARVARLHTSGERVREAELTSGERIAGDLFVSTIPTEVYRVLLPADETPGLAAVRYSALISMVCATRQSVDPEAYWINLMAQGHTACGIFLLSALNPTIGRPGDRCVNFVTHLRSRERPVYSLSDGELLDRYLQDFRAVFGFPLEPFWTHVSRVPMYSPVFDRGFRNLPPRSATWRNVYFAGNYRTFPSIVSTGTALRSGLETAAITLADLGRRTTLPADAANFRLHSKPRA
jgi:protoporphyrinogen oxidase